MGESIAERITARLGVMPASERKAAHTLIANYPIAGLKTVADFSTDAGVSSPTILRFVSRLGFQNYAEFQAALKDELSAQLQSPLSRSERLSPSANGSAMSAFVSAVTDNLNETFAHVSDAQIDAIASLLGDRKRSIYLVGGRFTDPIARYAAAHLRIIRPRVVHLAGQESNWRDQLLDVARSDVAVLFDIRRYQPSLMRFGEIAAERGVSIVLFTDQWLSPIARIAKHVIAARTSVPSPWDSSAALFVFIEALLGRITEKTAPGSVKRIREMEGMPRLGGLDDAARGG